MTIVGIIPARGGSKGVSRKNLWLLAEKPLIAWTIEVAKTCCCLDRIIVSTDDPEIRNIAQDWGAEAPFLRPKELARDDTPDFPVLRHAIEWLAERESFACDVVVWLRPTCPLRRAEDIKNAIDLLVETRCDAVRSVCLVEHHPYWMKRLDDGWLLPLIEGIDENQYYQRQLLPQAYRLNGAVDVLYCQTSLRQGRMFGNDVRGYVMPRDRSIDIVSEIDFLLTELLIRRRK